MRWIVRLTVLVCLSLVSFVACGPEQPLAEPGKEASNQEPGETSAERVTQTEPALEKVKEATKEPSQEPPDAREASVPEQQPEVAPEGREASGEGHSREGDGPCGGACAAWQTCTGERCEPSGCSTEKPCGAGGICVKDRCRSVLECCKEDDTKCSQSQEQRCVLDAEGCGKWSAPSVCQAKTSCHRGSCQACRHRACANNSECCNGTQCTFGYCLVICDKTKGELDNPDCQQREFCFPLTTGGPSQCLPDGNEQKGAACSIVKPCGSGLSCVNVGNKGFICYTDCRPSQGSAGNPSCDQKEQCGQVAGATQGGICVPLAGQAKKLYEACDQQNPCLAPNLCIGEPGSGKTFCLAPCDPTANPSTCPATDECAGYNASTPTKGVCLQQCSKAGVIDNCKYGECRAKGQQKLCL